MGKPHDDYKRLELPAGLKLYPCPVCAADAELWQYSESETDPTSKLGMCSNGEAFGPQSGIVNEGCLLYMPPGDFYRATIRDAVKYWNDYAVALGKIQRARRWARSRAIRADNGGPVERMQFPDEPSESVEQ
jgi:hypothetical protein